MKYFKYNKRNILILAMAALLVLALAAGCFIYREYRERSRHTDYIPYAAVRNARSILKPLAERSLQSLVDKTLDNAGNLRWKGYSSDLDVVIEDADFLPCEGSEVLVALSLPPQEAMIACYKRDGAKLEYMGKIPNLLPVTGISTMENVRLPGRLIVADQIQDEMLGAFFNARYRDIFQWKDGHFERVLGLLTHYNAYWNQAWDGVKEDAHWLWLNQSSNVEYSDDGEAVRTEHIQTLLQSVVTDTQNIPSHDDFAVRYFRMVKEEYKWNGDWGLYILGEYTDSQTGGRVALLEDYRNNVSSFIRGTRFDMVKVIDKKGEIHIISADRLQE
jgi:hypothetical protein